MSIRLLLAAMLVTTDALGACAGSSPRAVEPGSATTGGHGAENDTPVAADGTQDGTSVDEAAAAASCRERNPDAEAGCRWSLQMVGYCSGAAPVTMPLPTMECVCNECLGDSDCTARESGQCRFSNLPFACSPSQGHCFYPGDACYGAELPCPPSYGMPP